MDLLLKMSPKCISDVIRYLKLLWEKNEYLKSTSWNSYVSPCLLVLNSIIFVECALNTGLTQEAIGRNSSLIA